MMESTRKFGRLAGLVGLAALVVASAPAAAQTAVEHPTFSKDIAPILQRSCQKCHRPNALAPMPLISYEDVRPWARAIKYRTGLRDQMGVMPPWYIEKDIGIQEFKDDWSLSDAEIEMIAPLGRQRRAAGQSRRHADPARRSSTWTSGSSGSPISSSPRPRSRSRARRRTGGAPSAWWRAA